MKAKIFTDIDTANRWIKENNVEVTKVDVQSYRKLTTGSEWTEERIIVYYAEKATQP